MSVGRILGTKLDHVHKSGLPHDGTHSHTHTLCCNVTHVSTDALEGEGYELGVELVGGHAVDEEGEVF